MSITNVVPEPSRSDWDRFMAKVVVRDDGCWEWNAVRHPKGYGIFWWNGKKTAHRVIYLWKYGEPNCDLHHVCERPWCVNPEHITPAAAGQPRHRGPSPNFCAHGHEFTAENTYINPRGERQCRECLRAASARHKEKHRDEINAKRRAEREHIVYEERPCLHCGEPWIPQRSDGRYCPRRDCINSRQRENRNRLLDTTA